MPPITPNPRRIKSFRTAADFEAWLRANHDTQPELWLKIHKKDKHSRRGLTTMVATRRRLLNYLVKTDLEGYRALIKKLDLRR